MRAATGGRTAYPHVLALITYGLLERAAEAPYLRLADWMRDFVAWNDSDREEWKRERLRNVVGHARASVPFYREILASSSADVGLEDLPIVDKARIRSQMDAFLTPGWKDLPHVAKRTGGTTGDPWQYPLDKQAWGAMYASAIHLRERFGHRYGDSVVLFGGRALALDNPTWKHRLRHRLERVDPSLMGFKVDPATSLERARQAGRKSASLWYGYAGTLAAMADAVLAAGERVSPPKAILTTAEMLEPAWRDKIEEAFGPRLYDEYGCNDGGVLAQTCPAGRYHVSEALSIVEILDQGAPCPPGVEGDVTVTNLHSCVLPFLRYQVGDRAVEAEGVCPCGVRGQTLERVVGRSGDRLHLADGSVISSRMFAQVFKRTPNVRVWQVAKQGPSRLKVRLDVGDAFGATERNLIAEYMRDQCGSDVDVAITTDEPLDRSEAGKRRVLVDESTPL